MQSDVKQLPKSELLITIEISPDELAGYEEQAAKQVSEQVEIPGFRKGNAPKAFVISKIGADAFFQETLNVALPMSYFKVVQEKNLQVISRPEIKIISRSPLKFEARVAVFPAITIKGIEKIKIPEEPVAVADKEIEEVIEEMKKYRASYKVREGGVQKGDRVEIDFQGYDEKGTPLEKTKSTNHPLFVGEGSLVSGFEDELLGMKPSEKKKFPITFPKDFHYEPLRGKRVHFETEVKKAEETVLPELNEDFVANVMGKRQSVADFKEAVKADMAMRKKIDQRKARENHLLEKFLVESKLEVSPTLVNEEVDYMIADLKAAVEGRGMNFETYMKQLQEQKRDIREEYTAEAEKRVRIRLILNYLFRELQVQVTPEEMKMASERLIASTPEAERKTLTDDLSQKKGIYLKLQNNLMLEKLFAKFLDT